MKKAKIFLTALTVLAVAGGALAFKAKKQLVEFGTCDLNDKVCSITVTTTFQTTSAIQNPLNFRTYDLTTVTCDEAHPCDTYITTFN